MNTFLAAFIDEMEKLAKETEKEDTRDSTERSVHRGAGAGAIGLGALGALRGGRLGAKLPIELQGDFTPEQAKRVRRLARGGAITAGTMAGGIHGGVKGAILGGTLGFLLRRRKGKPEEKADKK